MTLGEEMRLAYSIMLSSPHGAVTDATNNQLLAQTVGNGQSRTLLTVQRNQLKCNTLQL